MLRAFLFTESKALHPVRWVRTSRASFDNWRRLCLGQDEVCLRGFIQHEVAANCSHEAPNVDMATQPTVQLDPASVSSDPKKRQAQQTKLWAKSSCSPEAAEELLVLKLKEQFLYLWLLQQLSVFT